MGSASGVVSYIGTGEDFETRSDAYTLTVRATDGASAAVFTAAEVTVLISNENDNAPLFAAALYSFTVPEGQSGTQSPVVIGSVSASDADGVAPLYSLSAGATERFSVGSASGVVSYIGTGEDFETRSDAYTLTVRATDGASAAVFTAAEVTVLISNENDNAPLFAAAPYSFTVPEGQSGTQSPVVIGSVSASDADGVAPLYSLSAGATERFSVGSASGVVSYIGTGEDFETRSDAYTLTVRATDGASAAVFTTADVTVLISNENDNAPLFAAAPYSFTVPEGQSGTQSPVVIGSVSASDADGVAPLYSLSAGATERFSVGSASGVVSYIGTGEDFETRSDAYTLTVRATDGASAAVFTAAEVTVLISNENDNAPLFAAAPYSFTVPEGQSGTQSPVVIGSVSASDADGVVPRYSLSAGATERFSVGSASGVVSYIGTGEDYETRSDAYTLTVRATDGASAAVFTAAEVTVLISNENDNAPLFAAAPYSFTVPEGQSGTQSPVVIGSVSASDADGVAPLYSLSAGATERFSVGSASGVVSYIGTGEDFETRSDAYTLTVRATDGASAAVFTAAEVTVLISNENDNAPLFAAAPYSFTVPEGQSGTQSPVVIGSVSASDADGVAPLYSLSAGATERFSVGIADGVVSYIGSGEDFEVVSSYTLTVQATDSESSDLFVFATVTVLISNENDNAPLFASAAYSFTLREGRSGTDNPVFVGSVSASDADGAIPGYSLLIGDTARFSIGSASGVVSYIGSGEDAESTPSYTLTVRASDGALSSAVAITIEVIADQPPQFSAAGPFFLTATNRASLGTVVATDANNDPITYSLVGNPEGKFSVVNASGVVSYIGTGIEDVTFANSYALTVRAIDDSGFTEVTATVRIGICDRTAQVREGIVSLVSLISSVSLCESVTEAELMTAVTDTFDLRSQTITSLVAIDFAGLGEIGTLQLNANDLSSLPAEVFADLSSLEFLSLIANDLGSLPLGVFADLGSLEELYISNNKLSVLPAGVFGGLSSLGILSLLGNQLSSLPAGVFAGLSNLTTLRLNNNDLSSLPDNVFAGLTSLTLLNVSDNPGADFPVGLSLEQISATGFRVRSDFPGPAYSSVTWEASGGAAAETSGTVTIAAGTTSSVAFVLPPSTYTTIELTGSSFASGFYGFTTSLTAAFTINLPPLFAETSYTFTVNAAGLVGTVVATDANGGTPSYSLVSGGSGVFSVSPASGVVEYSGDTVSTAMSYTLVVSAQDAGGLSASAMVEVVVAATAVAPAFAETSYTFTVNAAGLVGTVVATDANGGTPSYSLVSGGSGVFSVGETSGVVEYSGDTVSTAMSYTLVVSAQDAGGLSASAMVEVVVAATAVAPLFAETSYTFTVNAAGLVGTVVATDANGGTPSYSLVSGGSGVFSVSPASGVVSYSGDTVSTAMSYTLVVSAQDAGGLSASAMVEVVVAATAVAPAFAETSYTFTVNAAGLVGTVVATDANGGTPSYSLVSGGNGVFSVSPASGVVSYSGDTVSTAMSYTLVVSAQDAGGLSASATVEVVVAATAVAPLFAETSYTFTVNAAGLVGTVVATDANGGTPSYSLVSGGSGVFSVSPASGVVSYSGDTVSTAMSYTLVVSAQDAGGLSASATVEVVVAATAVAPAVAPAFAETSYTFTVNAAGLVGTVVATDANGGTPSYSLVSGGSGVFSVSPASGVVLYSGDTVSTAMSYTLVVSAQDAGGLSASVMVEVVVAATAVAPAFAETSYVFTVNAAGLVGTVVATDANGGTPSYSLVSGGSGVFSVSPASGVVSYSGDTVSTAMSYTLVVSAQDAGGLSASATVEVVVAATAVAPAFAETSYVFTVNAAGLVGTVVATDANGGTLSYSLVSGSSGVFSVVAASGVVSYSGDTVSTTVSYTLVVSAQDAGGLSATAAVTVEVTAIVNTAPAFEAARYTFSINDTETLLGSVQAMDADGDVLIYSLVSGGSEVFSVAAASGVIEYNGGAVANDMSYMLVVSASDGEGLSASAVVLATVRPTVVMGTRTQRVAAVLAGVGRDAVINAAAVFEGRFGEGQHITVSGNALKLKHWANGARASELTDQWGGRLERQWAQLSRWMDWDYVQRSGEWSGKERELSGDFGLGKRWERLEADWQRQFDGYRAQWNKFRKGLVSGSSFLMPLGASEGGASAGLMGWTVWGRGHASGYERVSDGLRLKGRSLSGYLGADYQATKALLLGVALSHSTSEGHSEQAADGTGRIDVDTVMAAVWPYANWDSGAGLSFWGALGRGTGTAELDDRDEQDGVRETDVEMSAVLFGVKRRLLSLGGARVSVKADGFVVAMESDAVVGYLNATNLDVHQLRLALSANNRWRLSKTARSRAGVELGVRTDGGDAVKGQGLDIGAQVGYSDAALGLAVSSRVRLLVAHSEDYHEWGLDATFELKPGLLGRGLALKLIPRWGQVTQANKLWADGITALRRTNASGRGLAPDRAQLLLSYGLGYGGVELRPYTSVVMRRDTKSDMSLGVKLNKGRLQFSLFGNQVRDFGASGMLRW